MLHEPAVQEGEDFASAYKQRLGAWMFLIYAVVYAAFVGINVARPLAMEATVVFGLNLAVVYGFGLIIFALVLALIYNQACAMKEKSLNHVNQGEDE